MSQILKPLFITSSVLAGYAAAAALVAFVSMSARAQEPAAARTAQEASAAASHAPIASVEKAHDYVRHILPNVRVAAVYVDPKPQPHYHVELRLDEGRTGRLDVDPRSGALSWRQPAVLDD